MKRIIPPVLFLGCLVGMVLLRLYWPVLRIVPRPWNLLGIGPMVVGAVVGALGVYAFSRAGTTVKPFRRPGALVTDGVFRYSRNPMYLGFALTLVGAWILLGALSPILGVPAFVIVADRWYIRGEEKMLRETFGREYEEYAGRTRRWG